jgi:hypothetical protein
VSDVPKTADFYSLHCDAAQIPSREFVPVAGVWYQDRQYPQRRLLVDAFDPASANERHVIGSVMWIAPPPSLSDDVSIAARVRSHVGDASGEYACSLRIFQEIWRPLDQPSKK